MRSRNNGILPIVMDEAPPLEPLPPSNFFSRIVATAWSTTSIPRKWQDYLSSKSLEKNLEGNFIVAENLRNFLLPYKHLINEPVSEFVKITMFFQFFFQLDDITLHPKIRELYLAQVVVLLQLLADPNSSKSPYTFRYNFLWNTFKTGAAGLDILNLLFSYGLAYKNFDINRSRFVQFLATQEKQIIYQPILDISSENEYIRTYHLLSSAYSNYKNTDYKEAARLYDEACQLLDKFTSQPELSDTIRKDYLWRLSRAAVYRDQCYDLLSQNNDPSNKVEKTATTWSLWNLGSTRTEESLCDSFLKKNN